MQSIITSFSLSKNFLPYQLLHGFQSAPWSILTQSNDLNVKYYSLDGEIFVALDRSLFYEFLLKQNQSKEYLKNTPKRLVLNYEEDEIYHRPTENSLKLSDFLSEIDQVTNLKISLPIQLDLAILVIEILKQVQSFVGIEIVEKNCSDTFDFIFKKFILGFPPDEITCTCVAKHEIFLC